MKIGFLKRTASFLLAVILMFTAVPFTAQAQEDNDSGGELENISSECNTTVPSSESSHPESNLVDGDPSSLWVNNGSQWPCTLEFQLPADNTKCVKKVVLKFESVENRSMDVSLAYALNGVISDLIPAEGSSKTAVLTEGYEYTFDTPQAMSHLFITLTNPNPETLWPAIAEVEIYVDKEAEEQIILENLAQTKAVQIAMEESVNAQENKRNVADGDFSTSAPLHTKTFREIPSNGILPFVEIELDADQRIRQFILAMKEDTSGAEYNYRISGRSKWSSSYEEVASGSIGTTSGSNKTEIEINETEYQYLKAEFTAKNEAARSTIPQLAEFQILANKAVVATPDAGNIAWRSKDLHSNTNQDTVSRIVDGNKENTWSATQYPAYVDIGLGGEYNLSEIEVYTPSEGYSQYSLYYSNDGQNYSKLAEKISKDPCPKEGEVYQAGGITASSVRILLEYNSTSSQALLNEVRIKGTQVGDQTDAEFVPPVSFADSKYNVSISEQDTIDEVNGIIRRNIGESYVNWFTFSIGEESEYDYFEIENTTDGKIHITGNDGISLATGLNHYLKYYCNVCITQVGNQIKMPAAPVPVEKKIHKDCKVPLRYAYNYCTMSYTMAFWGEEEWQKEIDWLALNGVNVVLDVTAQEEVWRQFLGALGYTHEETKDYIAGPAYYAWAYMANMTGFGGPVHDSWFTNRTELARKNHLTMRKLGMQPILQGYSGMVPVDIAQKAKGNYAIENNDIITQGSWCAFRRPDMLRTTSDTYKKYAALFYECQQNVFGDVTDYYATDPFHEGGNTGGMNTADVSSNVLDAMIAHNTDAVWVIQAWQGNPSAALVNGLEGRKEHALILDLYAEKDTHWNDSGYAGGREFQSTPWVYCMLNNFGGRMGLHGHMDNLVSGIVEAANTAQKLTGIGITPEGSQNNPVLYDLLFETVWCDDASKPLKEIDTSVWLRDYATRRYGAESENAYQALLILENTVYKASLNMRGQGAPESYINARPSTSINAASTWGNAIIGYEMEELEKAAELLLEDYELLKDSDGYQYDLADILKQVLSNSSQSFHRQMIEALNQNDLQAFTEASDNFLSLIDKTEEVLSTRKEFLLGTWVACAKALADGTDDFTKDLYEFNAKALVTTWGAYPQAESGGLHDYSNRQWAGLTKDLYKERWSRWIDYQKERLSGNNPQTLNWFPFEWEWARANIEYTTETSKNTDIKALGEEILNDYNSFDPSENDQNDYPTPKMSIKEVGSEAAFDNNYANYVLDGDPNTIWHTDWSSNEDKQSYDKHYLVFELEEETELAGLRYLPRQEGGINGIITGYQIFVSNDNINYELAMEGTWGEDTSWKTASFPQTKKAKYVKFKSTQARSNETAQGFVFSSAAEIRLTLPAIPVESIQITADKTNLEIGETMQLQANVLPENATGKTLAWESSDKTIATVSKKGFVTAKGEGTVTITAKAKDGSDVSDTITLTVLPTKVTSIQLSAAENKTSLKINETVQINAVVLPEEAKDKSLSWTSSDTNVATVDANGLVTAKAEGKVTITATAKDGSNSSGSITLTVLSIPVTSIQLSADTTSLKIGETAQIHATILPEDAEDKTLTFTSANPDVASVDAKGLVTAKTVGSTTITATAKDGSGVSATIIFTVTKQPDTPKPLPQKGTIVNIKPFKFCITASTSSKKTVAVTKFTDNKSSKMTIPSTIQIEGYTYKVTEISANAFQNNKKLTQVTISKYIHTIGTNSFSGCKNIANVSIKSTVLKKIGNNAFKNIKKNAKITVPEKQYSAYKKLLKNAKTAESIKIMKPLPKKGTVVNLKPFKFRVTASTSSKKTVAVTKFTDSKSSKMTIPSTVKINGYTYKVTEISANAFKNNKKLTQITISKYIHTIGTNSFSGCKNIANVSIKSTALKKIGNNAFKGIKKNAKIIVPKKQYSAYKKLLKNAKTAKTIKIIKK